MKAQPFYSVAKKSDYILPVREALWEAELKGDGLVYLAEKMSRQHNIQAVTWVLLGVTAPLL